MVCVCNNVFISYIINDNLVKMNIKIVILFLLFVNTIVYGQMLNIETFRLEKDTSKIFVGSIGFGYMNKKQINSMTQYSTTDNCSYLSKLHSYMVMSNLTIVKNGSQNLVNQGYIHLRMNYFRKKLFSIEQFSQIQYDKGRGLNSRYLTGVSMRYRIHSNDKWYASINNGIMYEDENWS